MVHVSKEAGFLRPELASENDIPVLTNPKALLAILVPSIETVKRPGSEKRIGETPMFCGSECNGNYTAGVSIDTLATFRNDRRGKAPGRHWVSRR